MKKNIFANITRKTLYFGLFGALCAFIGNILTEPFGIHIKHTPISNILHIAFWMSIISLGVAVALIIGQNIYFKKNNFLKKYFKSWS